MAAGFRISPGHAERRLLDKDPQRAVAGGRACRGAQNRSRVWRRQASRSSRLMALSLRLAFSRRRRDISTASKVLILVSMDEFEWVDDTDGRITLQQIDGVETGFALDVDEVFEVPAHEVMQSKRGLSVNREKFPHPIARALASLSTETRSPAANRPHASTRAETPAPTRGLPGPVGCGIFAA